MSKILVCGEALFDLIPETRDGETLFRPVRGGSPFNVAIGLGKLQAQADYVGRFSSDPNGEELLRALHASGLNGEWVQRGDEPAALAYVFPSDGADVRYSFYIDGTTEAALDLGPLIDDFPSDCALLHVGSFSVVREPSASQIFQLIEQKNALLSYDLNCRPSITPDPNAIRGAAEEVLTRSDLIKVSDADIEWLYLGQNEEALAQRWLRAGARLVMVTLGEKGVRLYAPQWQAELPAVAVEIADTVGAGDSFMAAMLDGLQRRDWLNDSTWEQEGIVEIAQRAARAAAITCSRAGSQPPSLDELGTL